MDEPFVRRLSSHRLAMECVCEEWIAKVCAHLSNEWRIQKSLAQLFDSNTISSMNIHHLCQHISLRFLFLQRVVPGVEKKMPGYRRKGQNFFQIQFEINRTTDSTDNSFIQRSHLECSPAYNTHARISALFRKSACMNPRKEKRKSWT